MKISQVEIIPIRAPRKEPVIAGDGRNAVTASEFGIVRIVCDDGSEGLGEISITAPKIAYSLCHAARRLIAPRLIDQNPLHLPRIMQVIAGTLKEELSAPYLCAAFEMALLDLAGRHYGIPVYQLLGGMARPAVPLAWAIYQKAPQVMADEAAQAVAQGYHAIKLKVGRALADDLAAVRAVAAAVGPGYPLRLDANMSWRTVPQAVQAIEALAAEATIAWIEQPLQRHNLAGLRLLRQRTPAPIMADESLQTLVDAQKVIESEAADVFNVYVVEAGGLRAAAQICGLADALDIPCILGSQAELGIGTAAAAHLGVTLGDTLAPCETFGPLRYIDDIVTPNIRIENGLLYAPEGPGLGVQLKWETVNAWRVDE